MTEPTKISVSLGFTANLGNFQSLRVDVGIQDWTREGEHVDEAFERIYAYVENKLVEKIDQTKEEIDGS